MDQQIRAAGNEKRRKPIPLPPNPGFGNKFGTHARWIAKRNGERGLRHQL